MFRSPIFWKLYAGFVLVILLSAGTAWWIAAPRVAAHATRQAEQNLKQEAELFARMGGSRWLANHSAELERRIRELGGSSQTRFTLVTADGTVLADTRSDPSRMANVAGRPEIEQARRTGKAAFSRRMSGTLGEELIYVALPLFQGGRIQGFVRAGVATTEIRERRRSLRVTIGEAAGAAIALSLLVGLWLSRYFTRPISHMTSLAESVAAGQYDVPIHAAARDEIGDLATALKRMSQQLQERMDALTRERNELRAILESMLEGVIAVDREERVVHMNDVAGALLGSPPVESVGRRVWEITRIEEVSEIVEHVLGSSAGRVTEVRIPKAHQERIFELRASPLRDGSGETVGAVLVLHDVTELRRLETVRRDFVANVSHELKTPLTAIRGFVETLLDDPHIDPATGARFLARAKNQLLRLSALVSDLLVLSRVESGDQALELRPIDLRTALSGALRRLSGQAESKSIHLRSDLPSEPVSVLGDEEGMRQIVDNLVDNAIKYTHREGTVTVRVREEGHDAHVEVTDTGIGIERKDVDRIFERFYRVDKARSRELGGTGLGLSIVKHLVDAHHGKVSVTSRPGEGSTFHVLIPLAPPGAAS